MVEEADEFVRLAEELDANQHLSLERLHELRWWHLDEIDAAAADDVWFAPRALGPLLRDLADHGLLDSTIVWWGGEFGRTPKSAAGAPWGGGRHHYGQAMSVVVAPIHYSMMVWGTFYGFVVFGQLPDFWTIAGAALIISTGLYTLRREYLISHGRV